MPCGPDGSWNSGVGRSRRARLRLDREDFLEMGTLPLRQGRARSQDATNSSPSRSMPPAPTCYAPGTRRHIAKALDLGATPAEILSVLQAVAVLGIHSVALGAPMLVGRNENARDEFPRVRLTGDSPCSSLTTACCPKPRTRWSSRSRPMRPASSRATATTSRSLSPSRCRRRSTATTPGRPCCTSMFASPTARVRRTSTGSTRCSTGCARRCRA